jgi:parvulin-like peptidyl-prolyl isomerase
VLAYAAKQAGLHEDPGVQAEYAREEAQILLQAHLAEVIVPQIKFRHDEFQTFYEENQDRFRGADEVRLGTLFVEEEALAHELDARLQGGADFNYLQVRHGGSESSGGSWISVDQLAEEVRAALAETAEGATTPALQIPTGWVIFKVLGKRSGRVPPLEDVDMRIREAMFQRKFTELLDHHLEMLKSRSEIVRNEAAIAAYFRGTS